jgi:hypothetical protein
MAPVASCTPPPGSRLPASNAADQRSSRRGHEHRPLFQQLATGESSADAGVALAADVGRTPSPCTPENQLPASNAADDRKPDSSGRGHDHRPLRPQLATGESSANAGEALVPQHRLSAPPAADVESAEDHRRVLLLSSIQRPDESPASPQGNEEAGAVRKEVQKLNLDEAERSRGTKGGRRHRRRILRAPPNDYL